MSGPIIYDTTTGYAPAGLLSSTRAGPGLIAGGSHTGDPAAVPGARIVAGDHWLSTMTAPIIQPPPAGPPVGQPAGQFARWVDLYVSGDSFQTTFNRFKALNTAQYLVFPTDPVTLPNTFDDLDSSCWYLTNVKGFGGEGTNRCQLVFPPLAHSYPAQSGTTQYTVIRQNNGPIDTIWGADLLSYDQPNVRVFHGVTTYQPNGTQLLVKDISTYGFGKGLSGTPPDECFQLQLGMSQNVAGAKLVYARINTDGRIHPSLPNAGKVVGGVGWTVQRAPSFEVWGAESHHNFAGSAATLYRAINGVIRGLNSHNLSGAAVPLNSEEVHNVEVIDPIAFAGPGAVNLTWSNYGAEQIGTAITIPATGLLKVTNTGSTQWSNTFNSRFTIQNWAGSQATDNTGKPVLTGFAPGTVEWVSSDNVHHIIP